MYKNQTLTMGAQWTWRDRNGQHGREAVLRLTDKASGMTYAEITMSPDQVTEMLSCLHVYVDVSVLDPALMSRIGKVMQTELIDVPAELTGSVYGKSPTPEMVAYAAGQQVTGGWDNVEWTRHNYGWGLRGRRWVDTTPED